MAVYGLAELLQGAGERSVVSQHLLPIEQPDRGIDVLHRVLEFLPRIGGGGKLARSEEGPERICRIAVGAQEDPRPGLHQLLRPVARRGGIPRPAPEGLSRSFVSAQNAKPAL